MAEPRCPDYLKSNGAMMETIHRAQQGDDAAMPAVRDLLDRVPEIRRIMGGELQEIANTLITRSLGGDEDLAFREAIQRKLEALRRKLEGSNPSPMEQLLVDRIVACWLQVQEADIRIARLSDTSIAQANFYQKRQDRAHRRILSAIKTLATVRKMALPMLQVNIAENQQVNVGIGDRARGRLDVRFVRQTQGLRDRRDRVATGTPSGLGRCGEFLFCLSPRPAQAGPDNERQYHGGCIPAGRSA